MPVFYRVDVSARGLAGAIQGDGRRWLEHVADEIKALAIIEAPTRTFQLASSHDVNWLAGSNQYTVRYEIANFAPHAENVHEGYPRGATTSIPDSIWADSDEGMAVPRYPDATVRMRRQSVAGQARNPWLDRAGTQIAMRYGGIPYG